jgi:hypothetical protein
MLYICSQKLRILNSVELPAILTKIFYRILHPVHENIGTVTVENTAAISNVTKLCWPLLIVLVKFKSIQRFGNWIFFRHQA